MTFHAREAACVFWGELRRHLRDGQTLAYSIGLPLFLYPAVFVGLAEVVTIVRGASERSISRIAVAGAERGPALAEGLAGQEKIRVVPLPGPAEGPLVENARDWIRDAKLEAVVAPETDPEGRPRLRVLYSGSAQGSSTARSRLEESLAEIRKQDLERRAGSLGEDQGFIETLLVSEVDLTSRERRLRDSLARVAPLFLVLMAAVGAFYPALDATVGERERGTIETTLVLPVGRGALVVGKFLSVAGLSLLSVLLNFLSLGIAVWFFLLESGVHASLGPFPAGTVAAFLAAALLLCLLLSAMMMAVALFARSFKEGQSYLGPILMGAMAPGIASALPEIHLTPLFAVVPVLNLTLALRESLEERLDPALGLAAFLLGAAYTALAIRIASRISSRESVLLGSAAPAGKGRWRLFARGGN
jgi:sodium transport system permease protein